jgi:Transglutaminase-like superfamily
VTGVSERPRSRLVRLRRRALAPVHTVNAGLWAARELRHLRTTLARDGVRSTVRRPPRRVSRRSGRVVMFAARVGNATCLERSLLRQAWLRGRGTLRDVVIGIRSQDEFEAHAWLDGDPDGADYVEIHRIRSESSHPSPQT